MHRRARHINPKTAGAVVAWDTRYMPTQITGSAVSAWQDRLAPTRYTAQQNTTSLQPTYQVNVQAGQPAVRFSGTNRLSHAVSRNAAMTVMHVLKVTGGGTIQQSASFAATSMALRCSFNPRANSSTNAGTYVGSWISAGFTAADFAVYTMTDDSAGAITFSKAGVAGNSFTGQGSYTDTARDRRIIGGVSGISEGLTGDYCLATMFPAVLLAPLRKRMQHAAAFSFKLQCA